MAILKPLQTIFTGSMKTVPGRIAFGGMTGSGKTTTLGNIDAGCMDRHKKDPTFTSIMVEGGVGAKDIKDRMFCGMFPEKTPKSGKESKGFESRIIINQKKFVGPLHMGTNSWEIVFMETAGEDIEDFTMKFRKGMYDTTFDDRTLLGKLYKYFFASQALILTFGVPGAMDRSIKYEKDEDGAYYRVPTVDLETSRLLNLYLNYKMNNANIEDIKGILMIPTMYDLKARELEAEDPPMDLVKGDGIERFMETYMFDTHRVLTFYNEQVKENRVKYIPTWVNLEQRDGKILYHDNPDGSPGNIPKIALHDSPPYRPKCSWGQVDKIIDWVLVLK